MSFSLDALGAGWTPYICAAVFVGGVIAVRSLKKPNKMLKTLSNRELKKERLKQLNFDPETFQFTSLEEWLDKWNENCFCYHAHIYYRDAEEKENAQLLRDTFKTWVEKGEVDCDVGRLLDKPGNGPHTWSYLEIQIWDAAYYAILRHLQFHHKTNPVLIHPVSVRHLENHTTRAFWLGDKQPVKEDFLSNFDAGVLSSLKKVEDDRQALIHETYLHYAATRYGIASS